MEGHSNECNSMYNFETRRRNKGNDENSINPIYSEKDKKVTGRNKMTKISLTISVFIINRKCVSVGVGGAFEEDVLGKIVLRFPIPPS